MLPTGHSFTLNLFRIKGEKPGPHCHIQSSVHGAELQGNAVIYELMNYFLHNPFSGSVTFIPLANPQATNQKMGQYSLGRFNPITGHNWNRNYSDLMELPIETTGMDLEQFIDRHKTSSPAEISKNFKKFLVNGIDHTLQTYSKYGLSENKKLNLILQKMAAPADIVLDLHTGPVATRYLYSAEYQKQSAKYFLFPYVLLIPEKFAGAMDEACFCPWVKLHHKLKEKGLSFPLHFESYTLELGGEERISLHEAREDAKRILNYLHYKNMVPQGAGIWPGDQYSALLKDYKTYHAPIGGLVEFVAGPGQKVSKGECLYRMLNFEGLKDESFWPQVLREYSAQQDCFVINHATSSSIGEGVELYQVIEYFEKYER